MSIVLTTSGFTGQIRKLQATITPEQVYTLCQPAWFGTLLRAISVCKRADVHVDSIDIAMELRDPRYQAFKVAARNSGVVGLPRIRAVGITTPVVAVKVAVPAAPSKHPQRRQFDFNPNGPFAAMATMRGH